MKALGLHIVLLIIRILLHASAYLWPNVGAFLNYGWFGGHFSLGKVLRKVSGFIFSSVSHGGACSFVCTKCLFCAVNSALFRK